MKNLGLLNAVD